MKRTPQQIEADVKDELAQMFDRLAGTWQIESGDVDPLAQRRWDEHIVPQIVDFARGWYEGNAHSLDMAEIARIVEQRGFSCYVAQTGGGCATIYAGDPRPVRFDETRREYVPAAESSDDTELRYPVAAGPGTFDWSGGAVAYRKHRADDREFGVGPDGDDDGDCTQCEGMTEQQIAEEIVRQLEAASSKEPHPTSQQEDHMSSLAAEFRLENGTELEAAQEFGRALMRGSRAEFKAGYSAKSAWHSCVEIFDRLTQGDIALLEQYLIGFGHGLIEPSDETLPAGTER